MDGDSQVAPKCLRAYGSVKDVHGPVQAKGVQLNHNFPKILIMIMDHQTDSLNIKNRI
jgi:hypothetical protein